MILRGAKLLLDFIGEQIIIKNLKSKHLDTPTIFNLVTLNILDVLCHFILKKDKDFINKYNILAKNINLYKDIINTFPQQLKGYIESYTILIDLLNIILFKKTTNKILLLDNIINYYYPNFLKGRIEDKYIYMLFSILEEEYFKGKNNNIKEQINNIIKGHNNILKEDILKFIT